MYLINSGLAELIGSVSDFHLRSMWHRDERPPLLSKQNIVTRDLVWGWKWSDPLLEIHWHSALAQVIVYCLAATSNYLMLTNHQWCLVTFTQGQFQRKGSRYSFMIWVLKNYWFKITGASLSFQWVNWLFSFPLHRWVSWCIWTLQTSDIRGKITQSWSQSTSSAVHI